MREKVREKVKGESGSGDLATLIYSEEEILEALLYETQPYVYIHTYIYIMYICIHIDR